MRIGSVIAAGSCLLLILTVFSGSAAGDTCGWYSFRNGSHNTATTACDGSDTANVLWTLDMSDEEMRFDTTPAIDPVSGTVYLGGSYPDAGVFFALDLFGYYNGAEVTSERSEDTNLSTAEIKWWKERNRSLPSRSSLPCRKWTLARFTCSMRLTPP